MKLKEAVRRMRREIEILAYACEYDKQADIRRRVPGGKVGGSGRGWQPTRHRGGRTMDRNSCMHFDRSFWIGKACWHDSHKC